MEITDHSYQQAHMQALLTDDVTFEVRETQAYSDRAVVSGWEPAIVAGNYSEDAKGMLCRKHQGHK